MTGGGGGPLGRGGRPPAQGRLCGGRGRFLGVDGGVTNRGAVKLGWRSSGGVGVVEVDGLLYGGGVVILPSLISLSSRSMNGSVETGLMGGGWVTLLVVGLDDEDSLLSTLLTRLS